MKKLAVNRKNNEQQIHNKTMKKIIAITIAILLSVNNTFSIEYSVLSIESRALDTQYSIPNTQYPIPNTSSLALRPMAEENKNQSSFKILLFIPPKQNSDIDVYLALGIGANLLKDKQYAAAEGIFASIIAAFPSNEYAWNNLGYALALQDRYQEAVYAFWRATRLNPWFKLAHLNLGLAFYELGEIEEARRALNTTLRIKPENADVDSRATACLEEMPESRSVKAFPQEGSVKDAARFRQLTFLDIAGYEDPNIGFRETPKDFSATLDEIGDISTFYKAIQYYQDHPDKFVARLQLEKVALTIIRECFEEFGQRLGQLDELTKDEKRLYARYFAGRDHEEYAQLVSLAIKKIDIYLQNPPKRSADKAKILNELSYILSGEITHTFHGEYYFADFLKDVSALFSHRELSRSEIADILSRIYQLYSDGSRFSLHCKALLDSGGRKSNGILRKRFSVLAQIDHVVREFREEALVKATREGFDISGVRFEQHIDLFLPLPATGKQDVFVVPHGMRPILVDTIKNAILSMADLENKKIVGNVSIIIEKEGDFIKITIADTGHGIPKRLMDRIFTPGYSSHKGAIKGFVPLPGGLGMGLPKAKREVEFLEGAISVRSRLSKGTSVIILIPAHTNATEAKSCLANIDYKAVSAVISSALRPAAMALSRSNVIRETVNLAIRQLHDECKQKKEALAACLRQILFPLKNGDITIERISALFYDKEKQIFDLISQIRENYAKIALLNDDTMQYIQFNEFDAPDCNMCTITTNCLSGALEDLGIGYELVPCDYAQRKHRYVHIYTTKDRPPHSATEMVAVDIASGQFIDTNIGHVAVSSAEIYGQEIKKAMHARPSFFLLDSSRTQRVESLARNFEALRESEIAQLISASRKKDTTHRYTMATEEEAQKIFDAIKAQRAEEMKYYSAFWEGVQKADSPYDMNVLPSEHFSSLMPPLSRERVFRKGLLKDENGTFWILKEAEPGSQEEIFWRPEKNVPEREMLAHLLTSGIANFASIRLVADKFYLTQVVCDGNVDVNSLAQNQRHSAYSAIFVAQVFMRKWDAHWGNISFVNNIPVAVDNDEAFRMYPFFTKEGTLGFYIEYLLSAILRLADASQNQFSLNSANRKFSNMFDKLCDMCQSAMSEDSFAQCLDLGDTILGTFGLREGFLNAQGLDIGEIRKTILSFKKLRDIDILVEKAGYEGAEANIVKTLIKQSQATLGTDVNNLLRLVAGKNYHLDELDKDNSSRPVNMRPAGFFDAMQQSALRPMAVKLLRNVKPQDPKWVRGVSVRLLEPKGAREISFLDKDFGGTVSEMHVAKYRGQNFVAKILREGRSDENYILPQARILNYLNELGTPGVCHARHFLQLEDGTHIILFDEFPEGETLENRIKRLGTLTEQEATEIIYKVSLTLEALHNAGIYHWDIKPDNIWITKDGHTILFDFDFAFMSEQEFLERGLYGAGSQLYMSGARREFNLTVSHSEEVYSLAMVLADMLLRPILENAYKYYQKHYAERIFEDVFFREYIYRTLPQNIRNGKYGFSHKLRKVLHKALNKGMSRYHDMGEFINDIRPQDSISAGFVDTVKEESLRQLRATSERMLSFPIRRFGDIKRGGFVVRVSNVLWRGYENEIAELNGCMFRGENQRALSKLERLKVRIVEGQCLLNPANKHPPEGIEMPYALFKANGCDLASGKTTAEYAEYMLEILEKIERKKENHYFREFLAMYIGTYASTIMQPDILSDYLDLLNEAQQKIQVLIEIVSQKKLEPVHINPYAEAAIKTAALRPMAANVLAEGLCLR